MNFVPNTSEEKKEMMDFLGIGSIIELFEDIDQSMRLKSELDLPKPMSESEIQRHMKKMSGSCGDIQNFPCFLGAGAYNHFIPSAVEQLISRGEFYTSYTPYQAEMSQGMLQSIFEFQSMICELTKMDVANASLYDGASAMAEAVNLAVKHNEKKCVLVSKAVHPEYRLVLRTYANAFDVGIVEVETENGLSDIQDMESKIKDDMACIIVQSPNFFGCIENLREISDLAHKNNLLLIAGLTEPISLGLLKPPGELGADIVVGEAQAFGNPLCYGGPHLGFAAAKLEFLKKMPGRISGLSVDAKNESGYILTLQAREQHVRRERATSNICTNQALNALAATIYLALAGKNGLKKVAEICAHRAHYAHKRISEIEGFSPRFSAPFFNEFVVNCPSSAKDVNSMLLKKKILGGFEMGRFYNELENSIMLCVTEMNPKEDIDRLVAALGEVVP